MFSYTRNPYHTFYERPSYYNAGYDYYPYDSQTDYYYRQLRQQEMLKRQEMLRIQRAREEEELRRRIYLEQLYQQKQREAYNQRVRQEREDALRQQYILEQLMQSRVSDRFEDLSVAQKSSEKRTRKSKTVKVTKKTETEESTIEVTDVYEEPYVSDTDEFCVDLTMSEEDRKKSYIF